MDQESSHMLSFLRFYDTLKCAKNDKLLFTISSHILCVMKSKSRLNAYKFKLIMKNSTLEK